MGLYIQIFSLIATGIFLLWFGYTLFFRWASSGGGKKERFGQSWLQKQPEVFQHGYAGAAQTCPVCAAKLPSGELVKSTAFPSFNGKDRLMHIQGCLYCLSGERDRICPVCGAILNTDEILISRIFERPFRNPHVHVLGCNRCRKMGL
ncbi:hypothetical protein AGMMS49928_26980 [Spirochaetia bacterium]|nr:hypothetical protein AGMMS49928_26980 [Spirochaetia bacterium]